MFEDAPYFVCPYGFDIGDDYNDYDECETCPDNCSHACGHAAFIPPDNKTIKNFLTSPTE